MTQQIPDILIYKGREIGIDETPLEKYYQAFPEQKPDTPSPMTALWRGYVATFEVVNNELTVRSIDRDLFSSGKKSNIVEQVFPDSRKFSWFSGLIRVDPDRFAYPPETHDMTFEYLAFDNGNLVYEMSMTLPQLRGFKKRQWEYFKTTEEYQRVLQRFIDRNPDSSPERLVQTIKDSILYFTRELYPQ